MEDRASEVTFDKDWAQTSPMFQRLETSVHTELMEKWTEKFQELQTKKDNTGDPWYVLDLVELEVDYTQELAEQYFLRCCKNG